MPLSYAEYTGDGTTSTFAVSFPYLQRAHVEVKVANVAQVDGTNYNWTSDTQIQFVAGSIPASGAKVRVQRDTPDNDQIVQWADGSYIIAEDLNESDLQWLYLLQELEDGKASIDGSTPGAAVKSVSGTAPITVDNTNAQTPIIGIDETTTSGDPNALTSDTRVMSEKAIDEAFKQYVGTNPTTGQKVGQIRIDNTGATASLFYWSGTAWVQVSSKGDKGDKGDPGPAPGLQDPAASAANVPLNADGSLGTATAMVEQDPTTKDLKFLFGIPVGQKGDTGDTGADSTVPGPPPGLQSPAAIANNVPNQNGAVGQATATVAQDGSGDLKFTFGIPVGTPGPAGPPGEGVDYKGAIDATTAAEPSPKSNGDFYVNTTAGTSSWPGLSTVTQNDRLIYNGSTSQWDRYTPPPVSGVDLNYIASTTGGTVNNSAGTNASIPVAGAMGMAGLMIPGDKTKLDGIADGAEKNPDLSNYLQKNDNVSELTNDANYITLADIPAATTPTLQAVLDEGNTSTTDLWVGDSGQTVKLLNTGKVEASVEVKAATLEATGDVKAGAFRIDLLPTLP